MRLGSVVAIRSGVVLVAAVLWHTEANLACGEEPAGSPAAKAPIATKRRAFQPPTRVPVAIDRDKFGEGWKQAVPLPQTDDILEIWVKDGWLQAKRLDEERDLDWWIMLAKVTGGQMPAVTVVQKSTGLGFGFELSYGRYFIHDSDCALRAVRDRPDAEHAQPRTVFLSNDAKSRARSQAMVADLVLSSWEDKEWFVVVSGRVDERVDAVIRLNPLAVDVEEQGVDGRAVYSRIFRGDSWVIDDGDLLVADRMLSSDYKAAEREEQAREVVRNRPPPSLDIATWLNAKDDLSLDKLKGRVVFVDFWGTWCGPCVKKIPEVQKLAERFADRGVVVIGVHSAEAADTCRDFVEKNGITFPIAIDSGKTAKSYAVTEWPSMFLIDKQGKFVVSFADELPADALIEKLLHD